MPEFSFKPFKTARAYRKRIGRKPSPIVTSSKAFTAENSFTSSSSSVALFENTLANKSAFSFGDLAQVPWPRRSGGMGSREEAAYINDFDTFHHPRGEPPMDFNLRRVFRTYFS